MNKGNKLCLAYGFFVNPKQMADKCPTAAIVGTSELKGYRLLFKGAHAEAVATVETDKDSAVPVLIWEITPADEAALDRCEDYPARCRKETVKVKLDGKSVSALVYIMNDGIPPGRPGAYHYNAVLAGYEAAGIDVDILRKALLTSIEMAESLAEEPL